MKKEKIIATYIPMTEAAFYLLLSLNEPRHGYGIIKFVAELTENRIVLGSGTVYGLLQKMQKHDIITVCETDSRKTLYAITSLGKELLFAEIKRIKLVYQNTMEREGDFYD